MTDRTTGDILSELRERSGMTLSEIAKAAGYRGPSSVQMMFSPDYAVRPLNPSIANRLVDAMAGKGSPPISPDEIYRLTEIEDALARKRLWTGISGSDGPFAAIERDRLNRVNVPNEVESGPLPVPTLRGLARDIPVYGTALAVDLEFDENGHAEPVEQTLFEMGEVITYARRPPAVAQDAKVYALYVSGSSMEPRYRPGDPLFVDPRKPPAIGDDVVVQLVSKDDDPEIIAGLIKTLVKRTGSYLELEQYRPAIRFRVPMDRVAHIHRVIPASELFGI